jgi:hypothetical protein
VFGNVTYIAIVALILSVAVSAVLTVIFRMIGYGTGMTKPSPPDTPV